MSTAVSILSIFALFTVCLAGLASLVLGLPGTFLIAAAALVYAWATGFTTISWTTPLWLLGLAIAGEVIELVIAAAAAGAASTRPSRRVSIATIVGAVLGGIVGTPFLFGVGSLLGAMAGAFLGAAIAASSSGGSWQHSLRVGFAAMSGKLLGFVVKSAIAVTMIAIVAGAVLH